MCFDFMDILKNLLLKEINKIKEIEKLKYWFTFKIIQYLSMNRNNKIQEYLKVNF